MEVARRAGDLAVWAVGGLATIFIVVAGLGSSLEVSQPDLSLRLGWRSPLALSNQARKEMNANHARPAVRLASEAMARSPLNVAALRTLGEVRARQQMSPAATRLMLYAGQRGWRDNETQLWLLRNAAATADYPAMARHADALARRREGARPAIFQLLHAAAVDRRAAKAILDRLVLRPAWREAFLIGLAADRAEDVDVDGLFASLASEPEGLTDPELEALLARLVRARRYGDALAMLRRTHPREAPAGEVFDGGFKGRTGVAPFAWVLGDNLGADIGLGDSSDRDGDPALRVEFGGFESAGLLTQLVVLRSGAHLFSGEASVEQGDGRRLRWELRCADSNQLLASLPGPADGRAWRAFSMAFITPEGGCGAVWLQLRVETADRRHTVAAWYDNLRIVDVPTAAPVSDPQPSNHP